MEKEYRGKKTDAVDFGNLIATLYYLIDTVVSYFIISKLPVKHFFFQKYRPKSLLQQK